jgi:hypothetical protein
VKKEMKSISCIERGEYREVFLVSLFEYIIFSHFMIVDEKSMDELRKCEEQRER